jgi:hypothetical protein
VDRRDRLAANLARHQLADVGVGDDVLGADSCLDQYARQQPRQARLRQWLRESGGGNRSGAGVPRRAAIRLAPSSGAKKKPVRKASAQFFLDWVRERVKLIKLEDRQQFDEVFRHHRAAEKFWQDRVAAADDAE